MGRMSVVYERNYGEIISKGYKYEKISGYSLLIL